MRGPRISDSIAQRESAVRDPCILLLKSEHNHGLTLYTKRTLLKVPSLSYVFPARPSQSL